MLDYQVVALIAALYQHSAFFSEQHRGLSDEFAIQYAIDLLAEARKSTPEQGGWPKPRET